MRIKYNKLAISFAVITFIIATFALFAEATFQEEDAKLYVVPALYVLVIMSGFTVGTAFVTYLQLRRQVISLR